MNWMKKLAVWSIMIMVTSVVSGEESPKKKYELSICSLFKNEADYLEEWLEYHLILGVEHFYLYNNESSDRFIKVLLPYLQKEIVTLVDWPNRGCDPNEENPVVWSLGIQMPAYQHSIKLWASKESEWLVVLDIDEFLVPPKDEKITDLLKRHDDSTGVILTTDCFNAYDIDFIPRKQLVTEMTTLTSYPKVKIEKTTAKMIFKPALCRAFLWKPYEPIFSDNSNPMRLSKAELRVNKYVHRFKGYLEFAKTKEKLWIDNRTLPPGELQKWLGKGYEIEDREKAIHKFLPTLRSRLGIEPTWTR